VYVYSHCASQGDRGWVANAGDARAVLCRRRTAAAGDVDVSVVLVTTRVDVDADDDVHQVTRVTTDHKPSLPAEEARIKAAGGFVTRTQTKRGEVRVCVT
jgi:serine/threonine protein phosphatase PrpC